MLTIEGQGGLGHFDHQNGIGRVSSRAGPRIAGYDREIGLWLGARIEGNRKLDPDSPRWPEGPLKSAECELDGYRMTASLRLADDELAPEKLQVFVGIEGSASDQLIVLGAGPVPCAKG